MPRTSTTTPAGLFLDLYSLQGLSMTTNINSFSSIPDHMNNMNVGELWKEGLGHMWQFQGKVMTHEWGGQNGVLAEEQKGKKRKKRDREEQSC